jgi:hypothetical protein
MTIESIRKLVAHRSVNTGAWYDHFSREVAETLLAEVDRLCARLEEIASQCNNLPRSATADRICELTKLEK